MEGQISRYRPETLEMMIKRPELPSWYDIAASAVFFCIPLANHNSMAGL
jgi:hypothetical protein